MFQQILWRHIKPHPGYTGLLTVWQMQFLFRTFALTLPSARITVSPLAFICLVSAISICYIYIYICMCTHLQISAQILSTREALNIPNWMEKGVKQATSKWNGSKKSYHFGVSMQTLLQSPHYPEMPGLALLPVEDSPLTIVKNQQRRASRKQLKEMFLTFLVFVLSLGRWDGGGMCVHQKEVQKRNRVTLEPQNPFFSITV